jgi:glycosyltransferase involved in cell wall biosynthesis
VKREREMGETLLSVCLITYNQGNYVKEAIEGVLMQKVNFSWDFIISDDYSTDGTREVVLDFKKKNSELIKLILQGKNVGAAKNWFDLITTPNSKYIAYFEGDDYWTDPYKLQKQVDFLDNHPDYSLCCHLVDILNEETKEVSHFVKDDIVDNKNRDISISDFLDPFLIISCSLVFRRSSFDVENRKRPYFKDITLFAELLSKGKGILLNDCMGVYRQHGGGVWSSTSSLMKCKANAYTLMEMNKYYKYKIEHIKTNASLQILDYLNLLIAEKKKNIIEIGKIYLVLLLRYRKAVGDKMLLKTLKRILKSIA